MGKPINNKPGDSSELLEVLTAVRFLISIATKEQLLLYFDVIIDKVKRGELKKGENLSPQQLATWMKEFKG